MPRLKSFRICLVLQNENGNLFESHADSESSSAQCSRKRYQLICKVTKGIETNVFLSPVQMAAINIERSTLKTHSRVTDIKYSHTQLFLYLMSSNYPPCLVYIYRKALLPPCLVSWSWRWKDWLGENILFFSEWKTRLFSLYFCSRCLIPGDTALGCDSWLVFSMGWWSHSH